jgi:hypothetical protein
MLVLLLNEIKRWEAPGVGGYCVGGGNSCMGRSHSCMDVCVGKTADAM